MEREFIVRQRGFEGPLELLLSLIEERKLLINDISLAAVTDEYIRHTKELQNSSIPESARFILIASTLLLIKSKSLLPNLPLSEEERESIDDLERRLTLYRRFHALGADLRTKFGTRILYAPNPREATPVFSPDPRTTPPSLLSALRAALRELPKAEILPKTLIKKVMSLEEMIAGLTKRITENLRMSFREFAGVGREEKVTVIVGFLALLELVKQGLIAVAQEKHFADITMETESVSIPRYE